MTALRRSATRRVVLAVVGACLAGAAWLPAQQATLPPAEQQRRKDLERELQSIAVVERKVMMPMRDGIRLATDIYRPKNATGPVPVVFSKTPYNFNYWDVRNRVPSDMSTPLAAVRRGYAYVVQNERGHFFSEGHYDILGAPITDGYDAIDWLTKQPWSNGKVGTTGCSSTAEWQPAVAALGHPGFAAMNVQGFGAGVGRVGPYLEQGNWYRGGATQMLFITWLYGEQNQVRPQFPRDTSREDLVAASRLFDLAPQMPPVDWDTVLWTLPTQDILKAADGPRGVFADAMPVPTGGAMVARTPNDPAWYKGGLWHDDKPLNLPGLWFMSWYDVSVGPNLAMFDHVRKTATPEVANQQWAIIAPVGHCAYTRASAETIVGERSMGDARLDYNDIVYGFFDKFLMGKGETRLDRLPRVTYFRMGSNTWQTSETWPPKGARPQTYYLASGGRANSLNGDGVLTTAAPAIDTPDAFVYDPLNPVRSFGGNVCCTGHAIQAGSFDQRRMEARHDVLVYTTEPFAEDTEVSGPITPTLYVSSDAKDTDFTVKVLDVYPDGRAYNLDESIQRMRYRDGYTAPPVWMEKGKVYKVTLQPLNTSNYFAAGHRLRIEVSSSNFPRFDRNLNTGGHNYDERTPVVARNVVHHSTQYPSSITVTVVPALASSQASRDRMRADLAFLTSPALEGRASLTPGADAAAKFLASALRKAGLQPGDGDGYLQQFELVPLRLDRDRSSVVVRHAGVEQRFVPVAASFPDPTREIDLRLDVVFAGYGISAPEFGYDDYAGVDVRGKAVLVFDHEPQEDDPASPFHGTGFTLHANVWTKTWTAQQHGAAAILVVTEPVNAHRSAPRPPDRANAPSQASTSSELRIPRISLSAEAAAALLKGTGRTPADWQRDIDSALRPASRPLEGIAVTVRAVNAEKVAQASWNVVGLLPGTDPRLRDETILVTSHYDHLGVQGGKTYPGANDNGSGTVAMVEVARLLAGTRLARSVLFVSFGSEEQLMLGSYHYVAHPLRRLATTRAVLNLDMIGRNEEHTPESLGAYAITAGRADQLNLVGAAYSPDLAALLQRESTGSGLALSDKFDRDSSMRVLFRCDHLPFLQKGIPAVWLFGGFHPGYHEPVDTLDRLDFDKMARVVRLTADAVRALASTAPPPRFRYPAATQPTR